MVLVAEGRPDAQESPASWQEEAENFLDEGYSVKTALEISERRGVPKNAVKDFLLELQNRRP